MKAAGLLAFAPLAALAAVLACGQPRTPASVAETDGGELTCDEKARAQVICQAALRQRCEAQSDQCDLACGVPGGAMPSTPADPAENAPEIADMKITQCRQNCAHGRDGCIASVPGTCPVPCR